MAAGTKAEMTTAYPKSKNDLLAIFVERGLQLMRAELGFKHQVQRLI
jgi:hypothetical protein